MILNCGGGGGEMDRTLENRAYEEVSLIDIVKRLKQINGIRGTDPITKWEEDSAKIELLTEALDALNWNHSLEDKAIERIRELREVLLWKRCDLGKLLLEGSADALNEEKAVGGIRMKLHLGKRHPLATCPALIEG